MDRHAQIGSVHLVLTPRKRPSSGAPTVPRNGGRSPNREIRRHRRVRRDTGFDRSIGVVIRRVAVCFSNLHAVFVRVHMGRDQGYALVLIRRLLFPSTNRDEHS
jgi:hypothetical protein